LKRDFKYSIVLGRRDNQEKKKEGREYSGGGYSQRGMETAARHMCITTGARRKVRGNISSRGVRGKTSKNSITRPKAPSPERGPDRPGKLAF